MKYILMAAAFLLLGRAHAQNISGRQTPDTTLPAQDTLITGEDEEELEDVQISSTRSSRSISDIPTRVEFIAGEELEEKANMKPGDIRMLLAESTGIQTQQTSATSANASIRIQGLDGRYTQILKDGFPLYTGAAGGLGLLQTPPLDLKQAEFVKGSASTLYGGGAIAGLVNLISKTPGKERELNFLVNGTTAGGLDVNGFYSKRSGYFGTTVYAARNSNAPYDPAGIDLTAIPKFIRWTVNPRLYFYPGEKTVIMVGVNTTFEDRTGGDVHFVRGEDDPGHTYFERNKTERLSVQASVNHRFSDRNSFTLKASNAYFSRVIEIPGYSFDGVQNSIYSEAVYNHNGNRLDWLAGANFVTDRFERRGVYSGPSTRLDYSLRTPGLFTQATWRINSRLSLEGGLRGDYVVDYGSVLLPRVSLLYKANAHFSSRIGAGYGYKAPTIFTEETERIQYRNLLAVTPKRNRLEHSNGANWDFNYRTSLFGGAVSFSANQLFFYTRIYDPLLLRPRGAEYELYNESGHIDSRGGETNIKLGYHDLKLYLGYTFTDAQIHTAAGKRENPLTPRNRVNTVLMYEVEDKWKLGLEAYYYSPQRLSDGSTGQSYWLCGFMAEKIWEHVSLYINFENFLDARQTRFDTIYTGTLANPQFRDIYAPLDGFVVNGGIKLRL